MQVQHQGGNSRLDAFVDAAFAFAVTLLVIGGGEPPRTYAALRAVMEHVPAFAVGFALLGMFWHAHVRWRRVCGSGSVSAVLLSYGLVFLVLVYVYPLRMMADAMVAFISRQPGPLSYVDLSGLFTLYGLGFAGMSALVASLFLTGLRQRDLAPAARPVVRGEIGIWLILTASGALSVVLAQFDATVAIAPWSYAILPLAVGLFSATHEWEERPARDPGDVEHAAEGA